MLDPRVRSWRGRVLPGDPTNAGLCVLISCVSLQEFKGFGLQDGLMFIGGLAMTLFGVVLLSNRATEGSPIYTDCLIGIVLRETCFVVVAVVLRIR